MKNEQKKYDNGTGFNFISTIGEKLGDSLTSLNKFVFGVIEAKPYSLDWTEILSHVEDYKNMHNGIIDIDSFSFDYVLGYSLINDFSQNEPLKEAMYLHLRAELIAKKATGEIK